jgi:hypothetical protein
MSDCFLVSDMTKARQAAEQAYARLIPSPTHEPRGRGTPILFIRCTWDELMRRFASAAYLGEEAQLAVLKNAAEVMRAISELDDRHYNALGDPERRAAAGHFGDGAWREREAAATADALASHPVLAEYEAERLRLDAERAEAQIERDRLQAEQAEREAPGNLLAALRARGFAVAASGDGKHIALPPDHAAALEPHELDELKEHKAAILALLKTEAQTARPVVVA